MSWKKSAAKSNVGMTVLYKLLYFIDFDYYEKFEEQLIGATYIKNHLDRLRLSSKKLLNQWKKKANWKQLKASISSTNRPNIYHAENRTYLVLNAKK